MNRIIFSITLLAASLCFVSCNKDEDNLTGENGRPSSFIKENKSGVSFSYQGDHLSGIKEITGSTTRVTYINGVPSRLDVYPPEGMADGHGSTLLTIEEDNKIILETSGEPSSEIFVQEITLDENYLPANLLDDGLYSPGYGANIKQAEGVLITYFNYDPTTKNLIKKEIVHRETAVLQKTFLYEYDNQPGSMSTVNIPDWFLIYWHERYNFHPELYTVQFLNYRNNVIKETIIEPLEERTTVINYEYEYNKSGYPVNVNSDYLKQTLTIKY